MEPGSVPGTLRFSLVTLYGSDFEAGHDSREGTTPNGATVPVPLYGHEVSLDYARVELAIQYAVTSNWDVLGRLPWERKAMTSGVVQIDPATPDEVEAMQRNSDLHHRSETFTGVGDLMLLTRRRWSGVRRAGDSLSVSGGLTVPTGKTVENPYALGDRGIEHVHIQFGSGTVDPLVEASYSVPLMNSFSSGAYLAGRLPLYENRRGFRGPGDVSLGVSLTHHTTERLHLRAEAGAYAQGYGYWNGERDENTGLFGTTAAIGATWRLARSSVNADVRFPLSQRTLTEGDAFRQGPTLILSIGGTLR